VRLVFAELAWEDYLYWQKQDHKLVTMKPGAGHCQFCPQARF
jgi:hypothetical protein